MNKRFFCIFFMAVIIATSAIMFMPKNNTVVTGDDKKKINWDGSKDYPFFTEASDKSEEKPANVLRRVKSKATSIENELQSKITDDYKYRMQAVLLKNYYQKSLGMNMMVSFSTEENDLTDSDDIVVYFEKESGSLGCVIDDVEISERADKLIDFGKYVKSKDINFLYFHTPGKYASSEIYKDYSSKKNSDLMDRLIETDIDHINFNDYMPEDKIEYAKMFYRTDHHWLTPTALYANSVICEYMNENYGYSVDTSVFDANNYRAKTSDVPFMGSWGRKITEVYIKPEPFNIYYPKYHTDLKVYNSRYDEYTYGEIKDTLFDYSVLSNEMYSRNNYALYGYGDLVYCSIHNNEINDGSHVLIIKTSFADCMYPYLSAVFEDTDVIDLRYFKGSIRSFIEKNEPDTVIVIYGIASYEKADSERMFDFR